MLECSYKTENATGHASQKGAHMSKQTSSISSNPTHQINSTPFSHKPSSKGFNMCENCKNCCPHEANTCEWALDFKPVPGWTAEPTIISERGECPIESYHIISCPKFEQDIRVQRTVSQVICFLADYFHKCQRSIYREYAKYLMLYNKENPDDMLEDPREG
jgi:hypothetical protein